MTKPKEKPSDEDVQSNLDALNRTYETYNDNPRRSIQLQAAMSFGNYQCWLVERGVQFYLDTKSRIWKLGVAPKGHTRQRDVPFEEGGSTLEPLWYSFLNIFI